VDSRGQPPRPEVDADRVLAFLAGLADRLDAARSAGQPGIEDHSLAHAKPLHLATRFVDGADHLVAHHLRKGRERGEWAVDALEVDEYLFVVTAADPGETGLDQHPVGKQNLRVRDFHQAQQRVLAEVRFLALARVLNEVDDLVRVDVEDQCFHGGPFLARGWEWGQSRRSPAA
jgi:hypothetical protein